MKKENVIYIIKIVTPLLLICAAVVAVLAAVNALTEPVIAKNNEEQFNSNLSEFFDAGVSAAQINDVTFDENIKQAHVVKQGDVVVGYCFRVIGKGAYKGTITVLIALDANGKILGIKNVKNSETPDLGGEVLADGGQKDNYRGADSGTLPEKETVFKSGATRTSTALQNAVNSAFEAYKKLTESEGTGK